MSRGAEQRRELGGRWGQKHQTGQPGKKGKKEIAPCCHGECHDGEFLSPDTVEQQEQEAGFAFKDEQCPLYTPAHHETV